MAAAFSSGKLSWSISTERTMEAKPQTLLHDPKKAVQADRTDYVN